MNTVFGQDEKVKEWVKQRLGNDDFGPSTAIGVEKDGQLIAGVVYSCFVQHQGKPISVEMSVASDSKRWLTRNILRDLFSYPFLQLKVGRVQATVATDNHSTIKFNESLGFVTEGVGRRAYFDGRDCVVQSMLPHECRWIKE